MSAATGSGGGTTPALVLGGTGYVAGELLRLLAGHPGLRPVALVSESRAGEPVEATFPHLAGCFDGLRFSAPREISALIAGAPRLAAFSALPHGVSAARVEELLSAAETAGTELRVVDMSSDFRFSRAADWERIYGRPHGAAQRVSSFTCALPEHHRGVPAEHVSHPGCFTTAALLALVPLLASELVEPRLEVMAVTGSTGAGRTPSATTHHPERRSNMFAYSPLRHRHQPEMEALAGAASGAQPEIRFVPHAGPFARGMHATVLGRLTRRVTCGEAREALEAHYAGAPFVTVGEEPPGLQGVVGTNKCRLGVAVEGDTVAVFAAIDNLVKGAAGGAVQWMNRLLGLEETTALGQPGVGWL
jgi:N-acetyl-gamma-glutamyl-phosphate reductase common form